MLENRYSYNNEEYIFYICRRKHDYNITYCPYIDYPSCFVFSKFTDKKTCNTYNALIKRLPIEIADKIYNYIPTKYRNNYVTLQMLRDIPVSFVVKNNNIHQFTILVANVVNIRHSIRDFEYAIPKPLFTFCSKINMTTSDTYTSFNDSYIMSMPKKERINVSFYTKKYDDDNNIYISNPDITIKESLFHDLIQNAF